MADDDNQILYHYTSIEAFRSIVASSNLRATRYDQLNDKTELRLSTDQLIEAVEAHAVDASLSALRQVKEDYDLTFRIVNSQVPFRG